MGEPVRRSAGGREHRPGRAAAHRRRDRGQHHPRSGPRAQPDPQLQRRVRKWKSVVISFSRPHARAFGMRATIDIPHLVGWRRRKIRRAEGP